MLLTVVTALGFWAFWAGLVTAGETEDAALVFCLSPAERDDLVDAVVALDLAERDAVEPLKGAGRELALEAWRNEHKSDFERACEALFALRQPPQAASGTSGILATLNVLLPVAVGAVLTLLTTLLTTGWRDAITRGRQQADELRSAARAFVRAVETLIQAWTGASGVGRPSEEEVRVCRGELAAQLRRVVVEHPRWSVAERLRTELSTGSLGEGMMRYWAGKEGTELERRAGGLEAELQRLENDLSNITYALEHPGRPHRALRARTADPQT